MSHYQDLLLEQCSQTMKTVASSLLTTRVSPHATHGFRIQTISIPDSYRPFPSCFEPYYEGEAKCKVFVMKITFHSYAHKTNFHAVSGMRCQLFMSTG